MLSGIREGTASRPGHFTPPHPQLSQRQISLNQRLVKPENRAVRRREKPVARVNERTELPRFAGYESCCLNMRGWEWALGREQNAAGL